MPYIFDSHGRREWQHLFPDLDTEREQRTDYRRWLTARPRRYGSDLALTRWYEHRYTEAPKPDPNASGDPWWPPSNVITTWSN